MKLLTLLTSLFFMLTVSPLGRAVQRSDPISRPPYLVSIQIMFTDFGRRLKHKCAGAIISPFWVVTSATCLYVKAGRVIPQYVVVAGTAFKNGEDHRQEIHADNSHQYAYPASDKSNKTTSYDIGLIQVDTPFRFNQHVQPLRLPKKEEVPRDHLLVLSGWGNNSDSRSTTVSLIDNNGCKQHLENIAVGASNLLSNTSICSGPLDGSSGSCFYDRGSPLVQDNVLVGIATWGASQLGVDCGHINVPSVYTEISAYVGFIEEHAVDLAWPPCECEEHVEF